MVGTESSIKYTSVNECSSNVSPPFEKRTILESFAG